MTTRLQKELRELPIEPLPDPLWQHVERRLFEALKVPSAEPRRRSPLADSRWWLLAAGAASLLLIAAWLRGHLDSDAQYLTHDRPQLVHAPGVELQIEPETSLRRSGPVWTLERGAAEFRVAPRKHNPLTVEAAGVRVEVVGTVFRVERRGTRVRVETLEGKVRVIDATGSQPLAAGEVWSSGLGAQPAARPSNAGPAPSALPSNASTPGAATSAEPSNATPPSNAGATVEGSRAKIVPPVRAAKLSSGRSSESQHTHPKRVGDAAAAQRQRFEQASALEAHDPNQALQLYRALSNETGAWASNALFALARLEVERRLHLQAELDLRRYIQRYPSGLNVSDAQALLSKLQPEPRAVDGH